MKAFQRNAASSSASAPPGAGEAAAQAIDAGLVYVSDSEPGISRRRSGRGFGYRAPDGSAVRDQATLQRIRALAIPPAYTNEVALDGSRLVRLVRGVQQLPGQALFQYRDDEGKVQPVDSGEVNDYLRSAMGESFTAKDFRTWGGTLAAVQRAAPTVPPAESAERELQQLQNEVIKSVAEALGNTPAVCRKAYIDPCAFVGWRDGRLQRATAGSRDERQWERAALKFLPQAHRAQRQPLARKKAKKKST